MIFSILGFILIFISTVMGFYLAIIVSKPISDFAFGLAVAAIFIITSVLAITFAIIGALFNLIALLRRFSRIDSIMVLLSSLFPTFLAFFSLYYYLSSIQNLVMLLISGLSLIFASINWIIFIIGILRK
jgi:hypothetical protein